MQQADLFDKPAYPYSPAARATDTSRAAAEDMRKSADSIRAKVLEFIRTSGMRGATAVELSAALNLPYEAVQPRCSELKKQWRIKDSGQRRASRAPNKKAIVWVTA